MMKTTLNKAFYPGKTWLDTDGDLIQAHGGGMLYVDGVYYWFGENKDGPTVLEQKPNSWHRVDVIGVSCYSSSDLLNWKNEGIVLPADQTNPESDLHPGKVLERPKVIHNAKTGQFVLFAHVDTADYFAARIGVAVSDKPTGPYKYLGSFRPNGNDSRDMTVFCDEDGKAYIFYSSEWNKTLHITQLDDEYLRPVRTEACAFVAQSREAPAVFKHGGKYYLISSGCTGFDPNQAQIAVADSPFGPWKTLGNPCVGPGADITFYSQSTFVLPIVGKPNVFIAMFDTWRKEDLRDSRYVWLPVFFGEQGIGIPWFDEWDLSVFERDQ